MTDGLVAGVYGICTTVEWLTCTYDSWYQMHACMHACRSEWMDGWME
jgi:hypothetical protein